MPAQITGALGRIVDGLREFTAAQRVLSLIGLAVLAVGGITLFTVLSRPTMVPLFNGLAAADAAAITDQLTSAGVKYELADGGSAILVPEEAVFEQRLAAAAAGLPAEEGAGGYSLLDDMGVTSSEFQQDVTYKRALEGELAATIGAMNGVKTASVRLAMPEESVFVDEQVDPTASVFVETDRGTTLSTDQIQAIIHLTSASIEGMAPTDVAVIDADGKVLSAVGAGATGTADQQASDYEQRIAAQVQTMLDRVVGPGNATVAVAAEMDYSTGERLEESFTAPEGNPALSESSTTEEYEGGAGRAAGVLGPDNIAVPGGEEGTGSYSSGQETRNNAVNKVTETTTIPAGALTRQTVSVALDADAAGALDRAALTDLVTTAAGIDAERGDAVTLEVLPFNTAGAEEAAAALAAAEEAAKAEETAALVRTGIIAGAALLALLVAVAFIAAARRKKHRSEAVDLAEIEALRTRVEEVDAARVDIVEERPEMPTLPEREPDDADRKRAEIDALAVHEPAKTANYLRSMMELPA